MGDPLEIAVEPVDAAGVEPVEAFAKLRSYTPERACFLFESRARDGSREGRYSIVGYRVRRGELIPPGVDAATVMAELEQAEAPEQLAQALAIGSAGYLSGGIAQLRKKVPLQEGEGPFANFAVGATILLFDHNSDTVLAAGPAKGNLVGRIKWELEHGPKVPAPPAAELGASPDGMRAIIDDNKLRARATRAQSYLDDELERLVLAHAFATPLGETDPFDIYRALRELDDAPHGYYLDLGKTPVGPWQRIFGMARHTIHVRRRDDAEPRNLVDSFDEAMPHPSIWGLPREIAPKAVRQLEDEARFIWGGTVGYICPGGEAALMLADQVVAVEGETVWLTGGVEVKEGSASEEAPTEARRSVAKAAAAMAAAQG